MPPARTGGTQSASMEAVGAPEPGIADREVRQGATQNRRLQIAMAKQFAMIKQLATQGLRLQIELVKQEAPCQIADRGVQHWAPGNLDLQAAMCTSGGPGTADCRRRPGTWDCRPRGSSSRRPRTAHGPHGREVGTSQSGILEKRVVHCSPTVGKG